MDLNKDGSHLTVKDLKNEAKERGITGYSTMNRLELCKTLGYAESKRATRSKARNDIKPTTRKRKPKASPKVSPTPKKKKSPKPKGKKSTPMNKQNKPLEPKRTFYPDKKIKSETWYDNEENKIKALSYHENGKKKSEMYYNKDELHKDNAPALNLWSKTGVKTREEWYKKGKLHREDGPAQTLWMTSGKLMANLWYYNGNKIDAPIDGAKAKPAPARNNVVKKKVLSFEKDVDNLATDLFPDIKLNTPSIKLLNKILLVLFEEIGSLLIESGPKIYSDEDVINNWKKVLEGSLNSGVNEKYFKFDSHAQDIQHLVTNITKEGADIIMNVIEYIAGEILDAAANICEAKNCKLVTPTMIKNGIVGHKELNVMFSGFE